MPSDQLTKIKDRIVGVQKRLKIDLDIVQVKVEILDQINVAAKAGTFGPAEAETLHRLENGLLPKPRVKPS